MLDLGGVIFRKQEAPSTSGKHALSDSDKHSGLVAKSKSPDLSTGAFLINWATSYSPTHLARAVPSGLKGLTSVFGMGTGGTPSLQSPKSDVEIRSLLQDS